MSLTALSPAHADRAESGPYRCGKGRSFPCPPLAKQAPEPLSLLPDGRATEDALNDNNVLKFEPRKPKQEKKPATPGQKKGLVWLAVVAAIVLVWAYYQFLAPQSL